MTNYYNEWESYPAEWLRNLALVGEIPDGDVDTTDIRLIDPSILIPYQQCHFFSGIGGWPLALKLAGHTGSPAGYAPTPKSFAFRSASKRASWP